MTPYEVNLILEKDFDNYKEKSEQFRMLGYWIISTIPQKKGKQIKLTDIMKFSWDSENNNVAVDKERMLEKAEQIKKDINNKNWKIVKPSELK
ncbi:MAG: hypothetical protein ACOCRK_10285 [bacterium]